VGDAVDDQAILEQAVQDPLLCEAIMLASPGLSAVLDLVREAGVDRLTPKQLRHSATSVLRYAIRIRSRATPFGLFAGVAQGTFGADELRAGCFHRHRTRPDMVWLGNIVRTAEQCLDVAERLRLQTHQGLRCRGGRVVNDSPSTFGARPGETARATVSVKLTPAVEAVLHHAADPIAFGALRQCVLADFPRADAGQIDRLMLGLLEQELLVSDLRPPLDGTDPLDHLMSRLPDGGLLAQLIDVDRARRKYDQAAPGQGVAPLRDLLAAAKKLDPHSTPIHSDCRIDLQMGLSDATRADVEGLADLLWRLSPRRLGMRTLRDYHGRFLEKYGVDRLVPVPDLIDDSSGLGAPAGYTRPESEQSAESWTPPEAPVRDRALGRLVGTALRHRDREVVLSDADLDVLIGEEPDPLEIQNSCELFVHVLPSADGGRPYVALAQSPGSHQAGATSARFADLLNGQCRPEVATHVDGAVPVELIFQPRADRAANLANVPTRSARQLRHGLVDGKGTSLRLADIGVGANLERLFAVHMPDGTEVVPMLPSMVSPAAQAPNAIRLLHEIGLEGQRLWEPWSWGSFADLPFLPRVRYEHCILAPAAWRLDVPATAGFDEALAEFRREWRLPGEVVVANADQRLLLDLDHPRHRELLRDEVRRNPGLTVLEPPGGELTSGEGREREVVASLVPRERWRRPAQVAHQEPRGRSPRIRDEWLYLSIYCSSRSQNDLLVQHIAPLAHQASEAGCDRWFYIRYTDSVGHHLRLRFHHSDRSALWKDIAPRVSDQLGCWRDQSLIRDCTMQPYEPELERYGGESLQPLAEELFSADSDAAIALLDLSKSRQIDIRTLGALTVTALARAFGPAEPAARWVTACDDPAETWLSLTGDRRDLPSAYRSRNQQWQGLLDLDADPPDEGGYRAEVLRLLRRRDDAASSYAAAVRRERAAGRCRTEQARIAGSLLHMSCNRLFGHQGLETEVLAIARGSVQDLARRRRMGR